MSKLTVEKKLYQLIISRLDGNNIHSHAYSAKLFQLVEKAIGGFIIFGGKRDEIKDFIKHIQSIAEIPLFIASDVECGIGQQIQDTTVGRVPPHSLMLMPAFGGGLTWCAHLVNFGARTTAIDTADVELPPCGDTALDLVNALRARKGNRTRSQAGLAGPIFPETQVILAGASAVA